MKHVLIDGVYTMLIYGSFSHACGHQYLTPGNASSHAFQHALIVGDKFRTNGHDYEVLAGDPALNKFRQTADEVVEPETDPGCCEVCNGPVQELGGLGQLTWYRCRNCGHDSSRSE